MNLREEDRGIAFLCSADGTILRIIRDDLDLPGQFRPGTTIGDVVEAPDKQIEEISLAK